MLYISWSILNLAVLCLFIFYCLVAGKAIRQMMGVLPLLLILFGLFSLSSGPAPAPPPEKKTAVTLPVERLFASVEDFYIASIQLTTIYQGTHVYHNSVQLIGFSFGCRWNTTAVQTEVTGSKLHYTIEGVMAWKILVISIYQGHKVLPGALPLQ